jgi:hypothetical protein
VGVEDFGVSRADVSAVATTRNGCAYLAASKSGALTTNGVLSEVIPADRRQGIGSRAAILMLM